MKAPCLRQAFADIMLLKQPPSFTVKIVSVCPAGGVLFSRSLLQAAGSGPSAPGSFTPRVPRGQARVEGPGSVPTNPQSRGRSGHRRTGPQKEGGVVWPRPCVNRDHLQSQPRDRKHLIAKESLLNRQDS